MNIRLHPPFGIHDQGRRDNNEDCIYPSAAEGYATTKSKLFLVCDGVGGLEKGEVASRIVCETLWDILRHCEVPNAKDINAAIRTAEQRIDQYIKENQEARGMATTLTLLALHEKGATIAHIGDSRVYQIREGQCIFKTSDHSLVNELIAKNIITAKEGLSHPKRNVITKAISGFTDHQEADVKMISDIQQGDYFFLCTDGILESFSDETLLKVLALKISNEEKIKLIKAKCEVESKDNFSAYLVQIKSVGKEIAFSQKLDLRKMKGGKYNNVLFTALAVIAGITIAFFINSNASNKENEARQVKIESALDMLKKMDTLQIEAAVEEDIAVTDTIAEEGRKPDAEPQNIAVAKTKITKAKPKKRSPKNKTGSVNKYNDSDSYGIDEARDLSLMNEERNRSSFSIPMLDNIDPDPLERDGDVSRKMDAPADSNTVLNNIMPVDSSDQNNF